MTQDRRHPPAGAARNQAGTNISCRRSFAKVHARIANNLRVEGYLPKEERTTIIIRTDP